LKALVKEARRQAARCTSKNSDATACGGGIGIAAKPGAAGPVGHNSVRRRAAAPLDAALDALRPLLEDAALPK
jgi:hypothetical protein